MLELNCQELLSGPTGSGKSGPQSSLGGGATKMQHATSKTNASYMAQSHLLRGICQRRQLVTSQTHESRLNLKGMEVRDQDKIETAAAGLNVAVASTYITGLRCWAG